MTITHLIVKFRNKILFSQKKLDQGKRLQHVDPKNVKKVRKNNKTKFLYAVLIKLYNIKFSNLK